MKMMMVVVHEPACATLKLCIKAVEGRGSAIEAFPPARAA